MEGAQVWQCSQVVQQAGPLQNWAAVNMKRPAEVTLGIDLASKTGICEIEWDSMSATITRLDVKNIKTKNEWDIVKQAVVEAHEKGWWVGIDAPFGFPEAFGQSVEALRDPTGKTSGSPHTFSQAPFSDARVWRATEKITKDASGIDHLLSTVTDQITGHVINCDDLRYEAIGRARNWADGRLGCTTGIVEVYPAAALKIWKAPVGNYKTDKNDLEELVKWLFRRRSAPWLRAGTNRNKSTLNRNTLKSEADAFDALICALIARLASLRGGPTCPYHHAFTPTQMDLFRSEGWIHLPPLAPTLCYLDPANIPNIGQCPQCGG